MDKKKGTFLIIIAALLVVGSIGIGLVMGVKPSEPAEPEIGLSRTIEGFEEDSVAISGYATYPGNVCNYGGFFAAGGSRGIGVYGKATNTVNEKNYGGFFYASGEQGRGVFGQSNGNSGYGVKGWASNTGDAK
jgi:hypothetical protein